MSARFRLMAKALRNSIAGIFVLLLMISFMIVFFASMVYFTEISGMNYVNGVKKK